MPFRGLVRGAEDPSNSASRRDTPSPTLPSPPVSPLPSENPQPKEPTRYEFVPCLSYCCFTYDHLRGVALFAVIEFLLILCLISLNVFAIVQPILELYKYVSVEYEYVNLGILIVSLIVDLLLLWAVLAKLKYLILPWIVFTIAQIMFFIGLDVYHISIYVTQNEVDNLVPVAITTVLSVVLIYFWCVVWSLYMRMSDPTDKINRIQQSRA